MADRSDISQSHQSEELNNLPTDQSMAKHPNPVKKSPLPPKWSIILVILLLTLGGGGGWYWWQSQYGDKKAETSQGGGGGRPQGVSVKVAPVEFTTLAETSEFVGTLEAEQSVSIRAEMDGRVMDIYVRPGDRISQGVPIARLDSREAEVQLRQAQASLINAQARLAELQAGTRREEIAQSRARVLAAEANLAELRAGNRGEEIAGASARLRQAEANLAELRAGNRGEEIAQASARLRQAEARLQALSGGSRNQEIAGAQAQIADAEARVDLSAERVRRNEELLNEGAISRDRFDEVVAENRRAQATLEQAQQRLEELIESQREDRQEAEAEVNEAQEALALQQSGARPEEIAVAEAQVEERRQELQQLENGPRPEEIAVAEAQVEERRQELQQLENGPRPEEIAAAEAEVARVQAQVRASEVQLQDTRVVAPFSGMIGDVPVKLGDYVDRSDILTTLTENDALELRLFIPIDRLSELRLGLPVEITNTNTKDQDPTNQETLATGRISFISPQVNGESQTVLAKATFDNSNNQLLDGQFVRVKVIWNQRPGAVVVPATAVIFQGEERFVYIVEEAIDQSNDGQPQMIAKKQPVQLGLVQGDRIEIIEGLEPGEQMITSGLQKLSDGAVIRIMNMNQ